MTILKGIFFALVFVFFEIGKIPEYSIQLFYLPPQEDKRLGLAASSPIFSGFDMMRCTVIDNIDRHFFAVLWLFLENPLVDVFKGTEHSGAPPASRTQKTKATTQILRRNIVHNPRPPTHAHLSLPRPTLLCPRVIISIKSIHCLFATVTIFKLFYTHDEQRRRRQSRHRGGLRV